MRCPGCKNEWTDMYKARLDVYWCSCCETAWLIHKLKYHSFEEASLTNYEAQLKKDFLDPLTVPPKQRTQ